MVMKIRCQRVLLHQTVSECVMSMLGLEGHGYPLFLTLRLRIFFALAINLLPPLVS